MLYGMHLYNHSIDVGFTFIVVHFCSYTPCRNLMVEYSMVFMYSWHVQPLEVLCAVSIKFVTVIYSKCIFCSYLLQGGSIVLTCDHIYILTPNERLGLAKLFFFTTAEAIELGWLVENFCVIDPPIRLPSWSYLLHEICGCTLINTYIVDVACTISLVYNLIFSRDIGLKLLHPCWHW